MSEASVRAEKYKVEGDSLIHKVKELVREDIQGEISNQFWLFRSNGYY